MVAVSGSDGASVSASWLVKNEGTSVTTGSDGSSVSTSWLCSNEGSVVSGGLEGSSVSTTWLCSNDGGADSSVSPGQPWLIVTWALPEPRVPV